MIFYIHDHFTDLDGTLLEDHVPDIGQWNKRAGVAYTYMDMLTNEYFYDTLYNVVMPEVDNTSFQMKWAFIPAQAMILLSRMTLTDPFSGYGLLVRFGSSDFVRYDAGVKTVLKSFTLPTTIGDVIKFEVEGTEFRCYLNNVLQDSTNDATYTHGVLGFACEPYWTAAFWDDAIGTDIVPITVKPGHLMMMGID